MQTFTLQDIPVLINKLIAYVDEDRLKRCIATWRNTVELGRPIERFHQRSAAFHWWPGLDSFWQVPAGPPALATILLAKDAIKVLDVIRTMPNSVKDQLASALGDIRNAPARLFEVSMAHHFMDFGYRIQWVEESGKGIPEFIVLAPSVEFEVECKRFSVDAGRMVSQEEFARFGANIQILLRKRQLQGTVDISLEGRLPHEAAEVQRIALLIGNAECSAGEHVTVDLAPWGQAQTRLTPADDIAVDWARIQADMRAAFPFQGHGLAEAQSRDGRPVNPIVLVLQSQERDTYLRAVYETMKDAARRQLSGQRPGLLCIHLPEIRDFSSLIGESGLRAMTAYFFSKEEHAHVYAVSYSSDTRIIEEPGGSYRFSADALAYRNGNCRYPEALQFELFAKETVPPSLNESELAAMGRLAQNDSEAP